MKIQFPNSDYPLLIRIDFSNDRKWEQIINAILSPDIEYAAAIEIINDRKFEGLTLEQLPQYEVEQENQVCVFLVDAVSISHEESIINCIDLADNFGAAFRVIPRAVAEVANNLFISNVDFAGFQVTCDKNGIYRGSY